MNRWVALGTAGLMLLAACGDDDDDDAGRSDQGSSTETSDDDGGTTTAPAAPGALADVSLTVEEIGSVQEPTAITNRPGDDSLFVTARGGRVFEVSVDGGVSDDPLIDIGDEVETGYVEQGLLDVEFSPDGRRLYLHFSDSSNGGGTHIVSYDYDGAEVDLDSRREILEVDQPQDNHNGGEMEFGPDGYLYVGLGDGGAADDPDGNGQNPETLLGKLLRIDPQRAANAGGEGYEVPADNPFTDQEEVAPEIWALGLRNPWRFSFDTETGDLWIGDVGQNAWEEVDFLPADEGGRDAGRGANLGWDLMEGRHSHEGGENPEGGVLPVFEYALGEGGTCAVTGGFVYRGTAIANLQGAYVFADYCQGVVQALRVGEDGQVGEQRTFDDVQIPNLSSFGQDNDGELYAVSLEGGIYRITPA